jgi:hypothetical protein
MREMVNVVLEMKKIFCFVSPLRFLMQTCKFTGFTCVQVLHVRTLAKFCCLQPEPNSNGCHGLMCFDIVLHYQNRLFPNLPSLVTIINIYLTWGDVLLKEVQDTMTPEASQS